MVPSGTSCVYVTLQEEDSTKAAQEHLRRRGIPVVLLTFKDTCALRRDGYIGESAMPLQDGKVFHEVRAG